MSSLKSLLLLTTVGCFYAKSGDVAARRAATSPLLTQKHPAVVNNNRDFSEDIVIP